MGVRHRPIKFTTPRLPRQAASQKKDNATGNERLAFVHTVLAKGYVMQAPADRLRCGRQAPKWLFGCAGPAILAPREIGHNALRCKLLCRVSATREARWPSTSIRPESTFLAVEGRTPHEVYFRWRPASRRPGIEPRKRWPRRWPCARPRTLIAGQPGDRFTLEVDLYGGAQHLLIVSLKRAAWMTAWTHAASIPRSRPH